jgi:hypothetical protein
VTRSGSASRRTSTPDSAASAVGKASIADRSHDGALVGSEGKKRQLAKWARAAEAALRPILSGNDAPLILAANSPLAEIYRGASSLPTRLGAGFGGEVDRMTPRELAEAARPILDAALAARIAALREAFGKREAQGRATLDVAVAARAAARGAIETLMVDMDAVLPGEVDAETGAVRFAAGESAESYGVTDAIAMQALGTGAEVVAVRAADLPGPGPLAATLRYVI